MDRIDSVDETSNEVLYQATAKDVARKYGVSRAHVYNLADEGMPHRKVGTVIRFNLDEVDEWMQARTAAPAETGAA